MSKSSKSRSSRLVYLEPTTAGIQIRLREAKSLSEVLNEFGDSMQTRNLAKYLNRLLVRKGIRQIADVVRDSGLDKGYVHHIFNGKRTNPSREKMIAIAFGMHLDEDETQRMLKLAGHSELYPKVKRDAVILFAIQHGMSIWDTDSTLAENDLPTILPE